MAVNEKEPTIAPSGISEFFQAWTEYMSENPFVIVDREVTLKEYNLKPHLVEPCQIRTSGHCPDQQFDNPNCHACPHPLFTIAAIRQLSPEFHLIVGKTETYSGLGTVEAIITSEKNYDYAIFQQDGDYNGLGTIQIAITRRPLQTQS